MRGTGGSAGARTTEVEAIWDDKAKVWGAESGDAPGLIAEAPTVETLLAKLDVLVPELVAENGGHVGGEIAFDIVCRTHRIMHAGESPTLASGSAPTLRHRTRSRRTEQARCASKSGPARTDSLVAVQWGIPESVCQQRKAGLASCMPSAVERDTPTKLLARDRRDHEIVLNLEKCQREALLAR